MRLKIKPSEKTKRRYLLLNAKSKKQIEQVILDYIGILGWAKAAPLFVKNTIDSNYILSIERKSINDIRASFEISQEKIDVLRVSGTIKGLRKN